ncbi:MULTISPECIES: flagellar hook-length control protein FliK [Shewanella]|nr:MULTISPECIES: flagellar hook-length control protein FliK [Shewanella]
MQKMSNILLANTDTSSDKMSIGEIKQADKTQSSESGDFSAALEQASISAKEANQAKKGAQGESTSVEHNQTQSKDSQDLSVSDNAADDVNHVLAQINLAMELESTQALNQSGEDLPLDAGTQSEVLSDESINIANPLLINSEAVSPEHILNEELVAAGESEITKLNLTDTKTFDKYPLIDPETQIPLDKDTVQQLVKETGLSEAELKMLSPQDLAKLTSQFSHIYAKTDHEANLASTGTNTGTNTEVSTGINTGTNAAISSGTSGDKLAGENKQSSELPSGQSHLSTGLAPEKNLEAKGVTAQQTNEGVSRTSGSLEQGKDGKFVNILGEKTQAEMTSLSSADSSNKASNKLSNEASGNSEAQLKSAELTVKYVGSNASLDPGSSQTEALSSDIKSTQVVQAAHTSSVASSRVEAPQFQLSLRQNNEQANSMQEMIQRFSPVMKQQLVMMVSQGIQHAEIRLDPPELGQLMVRIQVQGDQTQVQFQVAQHQTRDIVEQALPRLKELLAEQGMQLTDSHVSQQDSGGEQGEGAGSENAQEGYEPELDDFSADESLLSSNQATSYRSAIDYYA